MAVLHIPRTGLAARGRAQRTGRPSFTLQVNALQALCRRVFAFRMVVIGLGAPLALGRTARGGPMYLVGGAVLLTFMLSYVLFRDWERFGPLLLRHRWLLAPDMAFCGLLLVTATPDSPSASPCSAHRCWPGWSTGGAVRRSTRPWRRPWWRPWAAPT